MNKVVNKWILKYLLLPFSLFISIFSIYRASGIILYTNDNNKLLKIDLVIIIFLLLYLFLLNIFYFKRKVISDDIKVFSNNFKIFISILLLFSSLTIYLTYYINYKYGKTRIENCIIKDRLLIVFKSIKTYEIYSDCDEYTDIMISEEFYNKVEKGMLMRLIINDGILGFPVLKEIRGKGDDSLRYELE